MNERSESCPRKKQKFEPYKVKIGGKTLWQVNLESHTTQRDGRRVRVRPRKTFANVEEARSFAQLKRIERKNRGTLAVSMPDRLRVAALRADEILRPYGLSLEEAALECVARRELSHNSETVGAALSAFLKVKEGERVRKRYQDDLRSRLGRFAIEFAGRKVADITAVELNAWLSDLGLAPLGRNTYHLRLGTFFEYCRARGWIVTNPIKDVPKARAAQDQAPGILSITEVARLLENARPVSLPYWLFALFCGLRNAELLRLSWENVHWEEALVEVPSASSKTASRRFVSLRPNLVQWLAPYRDYRGAVCSPGIYKVLVADRKAAGITNWLPNCCRHSFASYHLAHFRDPRELALEMGHTRSEVTFRHYRELVKPAPAERFWRIVPAITAQPKIATMA
jgi:integrase